MTEKPIYAISVFTGEIKGYVKFSEELENNRIKIDLFITGLHLITNCFIVSSLFSLKKPCFALSSPNKLLLKSHNIWPLSHRSTCGLAVATAPISALLR